MKGSFKNHFWRNEGTAFELKARLASLAFACMLTGGASVVQAQSVVVAPQNEDAPVVAATPSATTTATPVAAPPQRRRGLEIITTTRRSPRTPPAAPQRPALRTPPSPRGAPRAQQRVVTVVHRMSGWKMLNWLTTNGTRVVGVDEMPSAASVHTNIVAGYLSEDGRTVVVNLPQAEVEEESPDMPSGMFGSTEDTNTPNLMIVLPGGAKFKAAFVGIDGVTGLSLLEIDEPLTPMHGVSSPPPIALMPSVGQRIRLFAPERARRQDVPAGDEGVVYSSMSEVEGRLTRIKRAPSGKPMAVVVKSEQLTPAWTGAVATNEAGALVGIVAESGTGQTQLVPAEAVRGATARVLARRASVPQPWLGARGDAVALLPLERFLLNGWPRDAALELLSKRQGVLLSAIAPNSPAASAGLRPGDVIARISEREVLGVDDFSFFLNEAGSNSTVDFTVFRALEESPLKMVVRLSESLNPATATDAAEAGALAEAARTGVAQAQTSLANALTAETEARILVQTAQATEQDARARNDARLPELEKLLAGAQQNLERMQQLVGDARARLDQAQAQRTEAEKRLTRSRDGFGARPFDFQLIDGLEAIPISSKLAARFKARGGLLVLNVRPESAAARNGLQSGDVIETINGQTLPEPDKAFEFFQFTGSDLALGIVRDGTRLDLKIAAPLTEK